MIEQQTFIVNAFVSCSLRPEDKPFIDMVENILERNGIQPIGTVGKYSAAPMNPAEHMKMNVPLADIVVIVATPRYLQKDLQTDQVSYGLSEMVHVETGMAYMSGKPVVVFVQEGTHVGSFLPNITEYIVLSGHQVDLDKKWKLINSLLENAHAVIKKIKEGESSKEAKSFVQWILAIVGVITVLKELFYTPEPPRETRLVRRRKRLS